MRSASPNRSPSTQLREGYGWGLAGAIVVIAGLGFMLWMMRRPAPDPTVVASTPSAIATPAADRDATADHIALSRGDLRDFNVLVITMDTTRADHIGCYGNPRIDTPVIDGLARRGVRCANTVTPSPSTLPAHSSLMTGLYPHHHGARANGTFHLEAGVETLAESLKSAGYATAAFISAFVLDAQFGLDQGFDVYDDDLTKGIKYAAHMFRERAAELTNEPATMWLRDHAAEKFFAWIHYFDPHAVYLPPEPYRSRYADRPYDGEIAYLDSQIGALLAVLDETGARERTLVVVTSDHGEGLGEHGEQTHSLLIYDSTLHVPLIFHAGDRLPRAVIKRQTCLVDVVPTVLSMLGVDAPAGLDGRDLTQAQADAARSVYIETISPMTLHGWAPLLGIRHDDAKYIFAPSPEWYDLVVDPGELVNLHDQRAAAVAGMSGELAAMLGGDPFLLARGIAPNATMDDETRESLASLGYITTHDGGDVADMQSRDPKVMIHRWERVQHAINLQLQGRLSEALPLLEQCVADVDGDVFARQSLVSCLHQRGDMEKALEVARRTVEIEPNDPRIRVSVASILLTLGRLDEAEVEVDGALALEPDFALAVAFKGRLASRRGREDEAIVLYERAIEMDPGSTGPQAYCELGHLHLLANRLDEARAAFHKALEIDALNGQAHNGLANILIEEERFDEADRELAIALKFDPNQPLAIATRARVKLEKGELDDARKLCDRAIEMTPKLPQAFNVLGLVHRRSGEFEKAEEAYNKAIEYGPYLDAPFVNLAQLLVHQDRTEEAMRNFERALVANQYCKIALANLGAQHLNEGRPDWALDFCRRALAVDDDYALAHRNIVAVYAKLDRPADAIPHLRRLLELEPDSPDAPEFRAALTRAEAESARRESDDSPG